MIHTKKIRKPKPITFHTTKEKVIFTVYIQHSPQKKENQKEHQYVILHFFNLGKKINYEEYQSALEESTEIQFKKNTIIWNIINKDYAVKYKKHIDARIPWLFFKREQVGSIWEKILFSKSVLCNKTLLHKELLYNKVNFTLNTLFRFLIP